MRKIFTFVIFLQGFNLLGQITQANFTIPATVCLQERIRIDNLSTNASQNFWDFCGGDLSQAPTANVLINSFAGYGTRVEILQSADQFFGFILSGGTKTLFKLSFGSSINNVPVVTDLGDLGLNSNQLRAIDIVYENQLYFGFIVDSDKNALYRIDFGNSLSNQPQNAVQIFSGIPFNTPYQISSVSEGTSKYLFISNQGDGKLTRLKFNSSYTDNSPQSFSIPVTTNWLNGVSFLKTSGRWHCVTASPLLSEVQKVDFVNGLDDISPVVTSIPIPSNPMGIELVNENGTFYAFAQTRNPTLSIFRLDFGNSLDNLPQSITELKDFGYGSAELWNLSIYRANSSWVGLVTESIGTNIYKLNFPNNCFSNDQYSTEVEPEVYSSNAGTYVISLATEDISGNFSYLSKNLVVSNNVSSDISFNTQNVCVNNPVLFSPFSSLGSITSYSWDFGDGQSSSSGSAQNLYSSAGSYDVELIISSSNGCNNSALKNVKIYGQPSSGFTLPTGLICTNNEFTFANTTIDNFDGNLTYQWFVDNNMEATTRDLKYSFLAGGNKDVKLVTSIPGCSSEQTQTLNNVQSGPIGGFDVTGKCQTESIQFTNSSSGDISGYLWDFGNGQTGNSVNEAQMYSDFGTYLVSLQTIGNNGCITTTNKTLTIYSKPQPDFSLDLPPFSCAGTSSQFNDLTPGPIESNLSAWDWSFGDGANGNSTIRNPTYVYLSAGSYNVSLTTTTNFGCSATKQKTVQISQSPKADFSSSATCLNKPTLFTDMSGTDNKSFLWKIGDGSYSVQSPTHVFTGPGNFTAQLTVTGNNDCVSVLSKPVTVPNPPILNFSAQNSCAGQITLFEDVTTQNADPIISRDWDFAGKGSGSGASTQFSFSSAGTYGVKMNVTNQSGCSYSLTKNTSITTSPVADFNLSLESGPPPLNVQFTNTSSTASSYQWQFNDANNSASTLESPAFTYLSLGDFEVALTASNAQGCLDTRSKIIHVIVPQTEIELNDFTLLKDATTGSFRPVLSIKNNSNYAINSFDVVLDIAGNALVKERITVSVLPSGTASQILNYELLPGNSKLDYLCVKLGLTDDRLSDDTDLANNNACISLESTEILFPPYPNPIQGELHLDWIATSEGSVKISVFTQMGQQALRKDVANVGMGLNQIVLDLSKLNSGFYMLIFESAGITKTHPFVIRN